MHAISRVVRRHGDVMLAVALVTLMIVQVWVLDISTANSLVASAIALALLGPLAFRSRVPLLLLLTLIAGGAIGDRLPKRVLDVEAFGLIVLLALYSVGAHTRGRKAWVGALAACTLAIIVFFEDPDSSNFRGAIFFTMLFGAPWLAGVVVRRRRDNEARLERERDAAEAAVVEERARIARELHDVVAHAISVIVLQARGGRRLLDTEPGETRSALDAIEHTGQQALVEMRRLVGLLRETDEGAALAPQPTLAQLDQLVEHVRSAGLPVEVEREGSPVELPPGVDLSAYRIVQEALTNALKHAGPARALVTLRYGATGIDVDVTDDGRGAAAGGEGHGLVGIRERVAVVGSELEAGPRDSGGFAVRAHLPYGNAP